MKALIQTALLAILICGAAKAANISRYCDLAVAFDNAPGTGNQVTDTSDCAFAFGPAAGTGGYASGAVSATSGSVKASAEIGNVFAALGSRAFSHESLPDNRSSATGVSATAFMDDIVTVQGLTAAYVDVVFAMTLTGSYGASAGDSGVGSIDGTLFQIYGSLEDRASQAYDGINNVGCDTDNSVFSDHGSECNGTFAFAGGGDVSRTYLLPMRIANGEQLRIQMTMIAGAQAFIDSGADPLAFAGSLFANSLDWTGVISAVDPNGNVYAGPMTALASNGFDYAQSAASPEPGTLALGGLAMAWILTLRRRRIPGPLSKSAAQ